MCKFMEASTFKHNFNSLSFAPSALRFRLLCRNTNEFRFFFYFFPVLKNYIYFLMQTLGEHKTVSKMCLFHSLLHSLKLPLIFIAFNHAKTLKPQKHSAGLEFPTCFPKQFLNSDGRTRNIRNNIEIL